MAVVRTFINEIDATMAMSALEAAGIESAMRRDECGGIQPAMGLSGIDVIVADEDAETAAEVLNAPAEVAELQDGDFES